MWQPITITALDAILSEQLGGCTPEQRTAFAGYRVPFYAVPIRRLGTVESVFVVAELPNGLLYFEDVEEGFEISALGADGAIADQGCNQYELCHVLAQAGL
jgi:hypothetical protein